MLFNRYWTLYFVEAPTWCAHIKKLKIFAILFVHGNNDRCSRYVQHIRIWKTIKITCTLSVVYRLPRVRLTICLVAKSSGEQLAASPVILKEAQFRHVKMGLRCRKFPIQFLWGVLGAYNKWRYNPWHMIDNFKVQVDFKRALKGDYNEL